MNNGVERRKSKRREILEKFSFYICVPKLGLTRHQVNDISETGIGFRIETLGEFKLVTEEICELQFYLNQSLYLPLKIKVARHEHQDAFQQVGAIFLDTEKTPHKTLLTLVQFLDQLTESGEFLREI